VVGQILENLGALYPQQHSLQCLFPVKQAKVLVGALGTVAGAGIRSQLYSGSWAQRLRQLCQPLVAASVVCFNQELLHLN
jgi:hypothetical protein